MKTYVIGCGGGGGFLTPALCMLIGKENVTVVDGDTLERKNLNRQLFTEDDLGRNKAEALADKYGCGFIDEWFSFGARSYEASDFLISCMDNHPGRKAVLETCDYEKCSCVIAGNETYSADAYVYKPEWKDGPLDPRVYFPELITDTSGDPRRAAIGCVEEQQNHKPQIVCANLLGAALALRLYEIWTGVARQMTKEQREKLPYRLVANHTRLETYLIQGADYDAFISHHAINT